MGTKQPPTESDEDEDEDRGKPDQVEFGTLTSRGDGIKRRMGKRDVFAKNLRLLTSLRGFKATTACEAIQSMLEDLAKKELRSGSERRKKEVSENLALIRKNPLDPKWYRRLMQRGAIKSNKRTYKQMHAIALFFGVEYSDLWNEDLPAKLNLREQVTGSAPKPFAICTQQLAELLSQGEGHYDYLVSLLESLHREWLAKSMKKSK